MFGYLKKKSEVKLTHATYFRNIFILMMLLFFQTMLENQRSKGEHYRTIDSRYSDVSGTQSRNVLPVS